MEERIIKDVNNLLTQLFQKMHEAGYVWNAENKELKKIEQKPTDNDIKEALRTEYEKGRADAIAEMQVAWSEDDEHRVEDTIYFLDTAKKHYASTVEIDACIDWLKSLKDRVQPKQEWSEEDEKMLGYAIKAIHYMYVGKDRSSTSELYCKVANWLKSLKDRCLPQPMQERGKEDEELRLACIKNLEQQDPLPTSIYAEWLKSLRPQKQWKPSDEQINTLEYYMHTLVCNEYKEILFGLYTDLKKLREK